MGLQNTMGLSFSRVWELLLSKKDVRILMVGLDAAGKTTVLFKLKLGEVITTIPTIGFNVETVEYKNLKFTVWDIGGQDRIESSGATITEGHKASSMLSTAVITIALRMLMKNCGRCWLTKKCRTQCCWFSPTSRTCHMP